MATTIGDKMRGQSAERRFASPLSLKPKATIYQYFGHDPLPDPCRAARCRAGAGPIHRRGFLEVEGTSEVAVPKATGDLFFALRACLQLLLETVLGGVASTALS